MLTFQYLEKNPCPPLTKDNFSFSSRPLVGSFLQISPAFGLPGTETEVLKMSETEVAKRCCIKTTILVFENL